MPRAQKAGRQGGGEGRTRKAEFKEVLMPLGQRCPDDSWSCTGEPWEGTKGPHPCIEEENPGFVVLEAPFSLWAPCFLHWPSLLFIPQQNSGPFLGPCRGLVRTPNTPNSGYSACQQQEGLTAREFHKMTLWLARL